jgi:hypothetical protein
MPTEEHEVHLYRADWIAGEGVPWLLVSTWQGGGQVHAEWAVFLADRHQEGEALIALQTARTRLENIESGGLDLSVTPDVFLERVRGLGNAHLRGWLDKKYLATKEPGYRRSVELIPVAFSDLVPLAMSRTNKKVLARIGGRLSTMSNLRELLRQLVDDVPELTVTEGEL